MQINKITIISIFDMHDDFIYLQYLSILKHVKGDFEYIIFNNARTQEQAQKNTDMCNNLKIQCIRININYNNDPSHNAGNALNTAFNYLENKIVLKIDSDMFFINDIDVLDLFKMTDLIYVTNHNNTGLEYMWSGIFGINLINVKDKINFMPGVIPNTDTFGQSLLLINNPKYTKKKIEIFTLHNIDAGDTFNVSFNTECNIKFNKNTILYADEKAKYYNYTLQYLINKYNNILTKIIKFPQPYYIDIITYNAIDILFHFKSSNWCQHYGEDYIGKKKKATMEYLALC